MPGLRSSLLLALLAAACGNGADTAREAPAPAAVPDAQSAPAESVMADLIPLDGSGVDGSVHIDVAGDRPVITVSLRNAAEGIYQGHVHGGSCANRARSIVALQPVHAGADGAGSSTSTVDLDEATLFDGNHIVVYHEAGGSPGASITCAEIPQRS
jgi:hypothetical protein